jgi:hypothetical protein
MFTYFLKSKYPKYKLLFYFLDFLFFLFLFIFYIYSAYILSMNIHVFIKYASEISNETSTFWHIYLYTNIRASIYRIYVWILQFIDNPIEIPHPKNQGIYNFYNLIKQIWKIIKDIFDSFF